MELRKIASFQVDHTNLVPGIYVSRTDDDIVTYDLRMKRPNAGDYLAIGALHTIEHLFATYARSSKLSDRVIYVGPMGCRTGFYLLVRDLPKREAIELAKASFAFIEGFSGPIPGASESECGNWKEHDLSGAQAEAAAYRKVIADWTEEKLSYPRR
jgi:S-ribosylhomocysteine lyase